MNLMVTEFIKELIPFVVLAAAIPVGYILRHFTKEEMSQGKMYFKILWTVSLVMAFFLLFIDIENNIMKKSVIFSLLFISIVSFISWRQDDSKK